MKMTLGTSAYDIGSKCPDCGKARFYSRAQAKAFARTLPHRYAKLRAYKCGEFFHVTSADAAATARYRERGRRAPDLTGGES